MYHLSSLLTSLLLLLLMLPIAPMALSAAEVTAPVKVESGLLRGVLNADRDVVSFKGVPYAAPPVGALRWREPQPPLPWNGVRNADKFGPGCAQITFNTKVRLKDSSEDCLYLNVWVPAKPSTKPRSVLFFVHGGAYQFGTGDFDGEGMAKKDIILVTLNYRLGWFSGIGHPDLTKESPLHSSANYGSLDLIAALKWIQKNIAAFGGNPGRVVISGQSTGSSNVHFLTTSPLAKGLFHGLIAISFPYYVLMDPKAVGDMAQAEQQGVKLAKKMGFTTLDQLRGIPTEDLINHPGPPSIRSPVYPTSYPEALKAGLESDVPTITGMTVDDLYGAGYYTDMAFYQKRVARAWPDKKDQILKLYPAKTNDEAKEMWKRLGNEQRLADIFYWAKTRAKTAKTPVYTYLFTQAQPLEPEKGSYHGSDMFYEFNNVRHTNPKWRDEDREVAEQVSSYWVNFINTGNPNGPKLPTWKAFDANDPSTMYLGKKSESRLISPSREAWELLHKRPADR